MINQPTKTAKIDLINNCIKAERDLYKAVTSVKTYDSVTVTFTSHLCVQMHTNICMHGQVLSHIV